MNETEIDQNRNFKSMDDLRRTESLVNLDIECPICKEKVV